MNKKILIILLVLSASVFAQVTVTESFVKPESYDNAEIIEWKTTYNQDFVELKVEGTITNFRIFQLGYDEETFDIFESELLLQLDEISDTTIILRTSIPEGMPYEAVRWVNSSGEEQFFWIGNLGDNVFN